MKWSEESRQVTGPTEYLREELTERYVNLAFAETANFGKTYDFFLANNALFSAREYLSQLENELSNGQASTDGIAAKLKAFLNSLETGLGALTDMMRKPNI